MTAHVAQPPPSRYRYRNQVPTPATLYVEIGRPNPDTVVLQLYGEIDLSTLPLLDSAIEEVLDTWPQRIIVGLSRVEFLCCRGLSTLRAAYQSAVKRDASFALTEPTPMIRRILAITGVDAVVPVYQHMGGALAAA